MMLDRLWANVATYNWDKFNRKVNLHLIHPTAAPLRIPWKSSMREVTYRNVLTWVKGRVGTSKRLRGNRVPAVGELS
jgi:hypothetical protein